MNPTVVDHAVRARTDAAFEAAAAVALEERDLVVAGRRVRVRLAGAGLGAVVWPSLAVHEPGPVDPAVAPDAVVHALDAASGRVPLPALPPPGPVRRLLRDADGTAWMWEPFHGTLLVRPPDGAPTMAFRDISLNGVYELAAPLRQALTWALRPHGLAFLHAAAVGRPTGAVLLGAPSGAGKSSTAIAALLGGHGFLGDDYVVVTDAGTAPTVHAAFAAVRLFEHQRALVDPEGRLDAARVAVEPVEDGREPKGIYLASALPGARLLRQAPLTAIVVPDTTGPPGLSEVPASAGLRALGPSSALQMVGTEAEDLRDVAALVRRVPTFRLGLDPDRARNPSVLEALLDDLGVPA